MNNSSKRIQQAYNIAHQQYAELGVDTGQVLEKLNRISISLHCWQGDDVLGFEGSSDISDGGIAVTGNFPGRARTPDELRQDFEKAISLIPGHHRMNLHASYAETNGKQVERNELQPVHFQGWIDWCNQNHLGLDFNPTYFAHRHASDGFTLTHTDDGIREFWIEHGIACRKIAEAIGKATGTPCVNNFWIPDGFKDLPADRKLPRERLIQSLDTIFSEKMDHEHTLDAVESKLFGIGSESYVVGSHEFYLGYAIKNQILLCLDSGHFHPTENISDKISSVMNWIPELLLHISRGVRWDSDHVVLFSDDVKAIAQEVVRGDYLDRTHIGLDFFDASINRVAAWVIGSRNVLKAFLLACLEPTGKLREFENVGDLTSRFALLEELKTLPFGAVWDYHCMTQEVPVGLDWLEILKKYESDVLSQR